MGEDDVAIALKDAKLGKRPWLQCKDCNKWYGAEDDEYGPCLYKHSQEDHRFVTYGAHYCDEADELISRGLFESAE